MRASVISIFAGLSMLAGGATGAMAATIGVSLSSDTNPFYIAMLKGLEARAKEVGHELSVVNANEDIAKQLNGINDLIAKGVAGIIISPIDAVALCGAYDNAAKANIPMMSIARGSACDSQLLHIAVDEVRVGAEIAAWTVKKMGGQGKIAMLKGPAGAQAFQRFAEGYESEIAKHSGISIVFSQNMLLTRENGLKYGEDALVAHPDIKAIYGANDELGLGAAQATAAAGRTKEIIVTGMNGVPPAVRAVAEGDMDLTVVLNPFSWGILGIDTMDAALKGKPLDKRVYIEHVLVDDSNVAGFLPKK